MRISWTYRVATDPCDHLFFCFVAEKLTVERIQDEGFELTYIPNPHAPREIGWVEGHEADINAIRCKSCCQSRYSEFLQVKFLPFSDDANAEPFLTDQCNSYDMICSNVVLTTLIEAFRDDFVILNTQRNQLGPGTYSSVLGTQWIPREKGVPSLVKCPSCDFTNPFSCAACNRLVTTCPSCGFDVTFRQEFPLSKRKTILSIDLSEWSGKEFLNSSEGVLVSGRVIEHLLERGIGGFAYGPVTCDLSQVNPKLRDRISLLSRPNLLAK